MKRWLAVIMMALMLCGCGTQGAAQEPTGSDGEITLWVVTEETTQYGMNGQAQKLVTEFENTHDGVNIRLDILPTDSEEREIYLKQLRTEIMAGAGPDVYLLPVQPYGSMEQLFSDVTQAMYNGLFSDISEFYSADKSLNTDSLVTAIMDAGTIADARYVLPLRYDLPVAYVNAALWESTGIDQTVLQSDITALWEAAVAAENEKVAYGAFCSFSSSLNLLYYALNFFPEIVDYNEQSVRLTAEEVLEVLGAYQDARTEFYSSTDIFASTLSSYCLGQNWMQMGYSVCVDSLSSAVVNAAVAQILGEELLMYPVAALDGSVVADISYYGAVGAGCKYPELAYEYLRMFLTEEAQWEDIRNDTRGQENVGLIGNGWPVRAIGGTAKLWEIIKQQHARPADSTVAERRRSKIDQLHLGDEDIPILYTKIDKARFSIGAELELALYMTQLSEESNITTFAEEFIQNLNWHLAEG